MYFYVTVDLFSKILKQYPNHTNAWTPVIAFPRIKVWISYKKGFLVKDLLIQ